MFPIPYLQPASEIFQDFLMRIAGLFLGRLASAWYFQAHCEIA